MNEPNFNLNHQFLRRASLLVILPLLLALTSSARTAFAVEEPATLGTQDTAVGTGALAHEQPGGNYNSAFGFDALFSNTIGIRNTAIGVNALYSNFTGTDNAATGLNALYSNVVGSNNTATGNYSLAFNLGGSQNTAIGWSALYSNTSGNYNTATGLGALHENTQGSNNTANGTNVLYHNTASNNAAFGANALINNTSGHNNTATGFNALNNNTSGNSNTALGSSAGSNLTTGSNNIDIGNLGVAGESSTIRIGSVQTRTFIKGISGVAIVGAPVIVNAGGQLGITASSARFKDEIKPMGNASEALLALKPVTFRYKKEIDPEGIPQFGLVAEDVEKIRSDLVVHDRDGKPHTVRYDAVNAMLLNEFLKEHRKVQELELTVAQQQNNFQARIAQQEKEIRSLTSGLQKVSTRLAMSRPAPRVADTH